MHRLLKGLLFAVDSCRPEGSIQPHAACRRLSRAVGNSGVTPRHNTSQAAEKPISARERASATAQNGNGPVEPLRNQGAEMAGARWRGHMTRDSGKVAVYGVCGGQRDLKRNRNQAVFLHFRGTSVGRTTKF
ncbi:hypothetical protein KL920_003550 [Ogataea angusta]|nr:hypothetical protein KL920_003550 [Ogataea angusta]